MSSIVKIKLLFATFFLSIGVYSQTQELLKIIDNSNEGVFQLSYSENGSFWEITNIDTVTQIPLKDFMKLKCDYSLHHSKEYINEELTKKLEKIKEGRCIISYQNNTLGSEDDDASVSICISFLDIVSETYKEKIRQFYPSPEQLKDKSVKRSVICN